MFNSIYPFIYSTVVLILLWQAFRVMGRGFLPEQSPLNRQLRSKKTNDDRTGRLTIHPELLDEQGRITEEDLLTVRFSEDNEPPQSAEAPAE